MNDALKELFSAYKHLPVGVMFFKEEKLFFINDHLRSILLLANLPSDDVIHIIGSMVGLEESSHALLNRFLSHNDFFLYHDRVIQIERQSAEGVDIFVLIRLSDKAIEAIDATHALRQLCHEKAAVSSSAPKSDEHEILHKTLGEWETRNFPSIVLYKGIPIKGECRVSEAKEGHIRLTVEKKQLAAAQIGAQWLVGSKRGTMLSGTVFRYDLGRHSVWLENLEIINEGFHARSVIRYGAEENDRMIVSINSKKISFLLRDVSEKGFSVQTDDAASLVVLSAVKGKTLDVELILGGKSVIAKAVWKYTIALDASMLKAAFTIGYDLHNGALLREWFNGEQLRLIKEVRNFVQMIPIPESEPSEDWII